ncbi:hypothetical protein [Streptomyces sp. NPDC006463]|uniref:hypothetical protein n=1 Tax=Streptomyces sp. NPDC006463 TaxID=3364746 RepID=UPI0036CF4D7B
MSQRKEPFIAGAAGAVALAASGLPQPAWGQALPALLRFVLVLACWPAVAGSVAAIVRNRAGTVLVLVVWPLIAERLTGLLLGRLLGVDGLGGWLPFAAARAAMSGRAWAPQHSNSAPQSWHPALYGGLSDDSRQRAVPKPTRPGPRRRPGSKNRRPTRHKTRTEPRRST